MNATDFEHAEPEPITAQLRSLRNEILDAHEAAVDRLQLVRSIPPADWSAMSADVQHDMFEKHTYVEAATLQLFLRKVEWIIDEIDFAMT